MRLFSYILSALAVFLLINIFLSYYSNSYRIALQDMKAKITGDENAENIKLQIEEQNNLNEKFLDSIEKLNDNINKIASSKDNQNTNSGNTLKTNENILGLPDILTEKLMPDINASEIINSGIFGLNKKNIFENVRYATYYSEKSKLKIYVIDLSYDEAISIFTNLSSLYEIHESNNFFGYTFYLNPIKKDNKIRFVILLGGKTIGFEIDTNKYESLKKLLLK